MKKQRKHYTGSEVGSGEGTAEESPPAGRVTDERDYIRFADDPEAIAMWRELKSRISPLPWMTRNTPR